MIPTRRTLSVPFLLALAIGSSGTVATGQSPSPTPDGMPITLTLGVSDPPDRPSQTAVDDFVAQVAALSGGHVLIEPIYEAGAVTVEGFEVGTAGLVADGSVDLGLVASRAWDLAGVTSLRPLQAPFLIDSDALAAAVAQSEVASQLMAGLGDVGVAGLAMWPEDLRHPFSVLVDEPLTSPSDFEGDIILVQPSGVSRALVAALGASLFPDDIDRGAAVEAGLLHGAESGLLQGASLPGTPTATGNVTFYPKFQVLVANAAALEALGPEIEDTLRQAAAETQRLAIENHPPEGDAAAAWCEAGGAIVLATEEEVAAFTEAAAPVFAEIESDPAGAEAIAAIRALKDETEPARPVPACGPEPAVSPGPS